MEILTIRPQVKTFALLSLWGIFVLAYFNRFPWPGFFSNLFQILLAATVATSAAGYGYLCGSRLWPTLFTFPEKSLFSLALGFGCMSLAMMGLGLMSAWNKVAAVALLVPGIFSAGSFLKDFQNQKSLAKGPTQKSSGLAIGITLVAVILGLLLAFAPITYYDSLVYHLALPQAYLHAGKWVGLQELIYSAFPQNLEMIWLLGLLIGNDTLTNLLGFTLLLAALGAVYLFAVRFLNRSTAAWAVVLLSTMPAFLLLSSGGYVDVGLSLYAFLSFYTLVLWKVEPKLSTAVLSGIFAGLALGVKYTGGLCIGVGVCLFLLTETKLSWRRNLSHSCAFAGAALLVFLPWMIKNILFVGNPVFPFFHQWSFVKLNPWIGEAAAGYFFHGLTEYEPRSGFQLFTLVWDILVNAMQFGGGMDVLGDLGWAPLFIFIPALWLSWPLKPAIKTMLVYAGLFYVPWALSRPVLRFLLPIAPILAILAAYAWTSCIPILRSPLIKKSSGLLLGALLVSNALLFFFTTGLLRSFQVIIGLTDRESYLASSVIKNNYYKAAQFVNKLPPTSLTYVVGDQRSYYFEKPVIVTPVFNRNPISAWANQSKNPQTFVDELRSHGVSHLLINQTELDRLAPYNILPLTPRGRQNWNGLVASLAKPVYQDKDCRVLEL